MKINTNIYFKELKRNRNSFIAWSIFIIAVILMEMGFYRLFMKEEMLGLMKTFFENPFWKNIMSAFGMSLDMLTNVLGYYAARSAIYIILLGTFFSIMLAGKILALEEREKTAEFLLTKPVTRLEIVRSKLAVFFTYLLLLNVIILFVGFIGLEIFKGDSDYRPVAFLIHSFYSFLLMLTFGAIGLFLSLLIKRGRPITNLLIGIVFGGYLIDILSQVTASTDKLGYLSPFKFIDTGVLRPDYGLEWWRVVYFLGLSLVLITITFVIYKKKDILI
ncbi:MAG: ABC transporter permease subunit [Candidatus Aminicenantaceae bacterium]